MDMNPHPYFENLNSPTAITAVFSCPGRHEEKRGRPCSGKTGKALEFILRLLHFQGHCLKRSLIGITNAWDKIEYKHKTKRSEASDEEILALENIKRLNRDLINTLYAIAFGQKALSALKRVKELHRPDLVIIESIHLSPRNINFRIKADIFNNELKKGEKGNTEKRLAVIANDIKEASNNLLS